MLSDMDPEIIFNLMMEQGDHAKMLTFLTAQMSAKAGLREFGQAGADAITKELEQLLYRKVMKGREPHTLTRDQRKAALKYLMFLKQKRCGRIKGRGCADGRKQRLYKSKEETSAPTISVEALFLTCLIDAKEKRTVVTCDIPGAFMHADMDELIHIKLEGELATLLVKLDPSYARFVTYEGKNKNKPVIYTELSKALYGTLQAALLFWENLTEFLASQGYKPNPYDSCVWNKTINGKQCTVGWHVDDLKISHIDEAVVEDLVAALQTKYGVEEPLTVNRGKVHDYLGMRIDFSSPEKVEFAMTEYVDQLLAETPDDLFTGHPTTPAANHLFEINEDAPKLNEADAELFHHLTAKMLYLGK